MVTPGLPASTSSVAGPSARATPARASRHTATSASHVVDRRAGSEILRMGPLAPDRGLGLVVRPLRGSSVDGGAPGSTEETLGEEIQVVLPLGRVVRVAVHVPDMRDALRFQVGVHALADADQAVLLA